MRFVSLLSGGFITAIVVNSPERKLAKCTSTLHGKGDNRPVLEVTQPFDNPRFKSAHALHGTVYSAHGNYLTSEALGNRTFLRGEGGNYATFHFFILKTNKRNT